MIADLKGSGEGLQQAQAKFTYLLESGVLKKHAAVKEAETYPIIYSADHQAEALASLAAAIHPIAGTMREISNTLVSSPLICWSLG